MPTVNTFKDIYMKSFYLLTTNKIHTVPHIGNCVEEMFYTTCISLYNAK